MVNELSGAALALQYRRDWIELGSWEAVAEKYGKPRTAVQKFWSDWKFRAGLADPAESETVPEVPETDYGQFHRAIVALPTKFRLAFATDIHLPDHDERAINLALKIIRDFQPHILPHGSDVFDFPTISRFETDPDDLAEDVWQAVNRPYLTLMRAFRDAAPDAFNPFLMGNHDERVWHFMMRLAPQFRHTIAELFISTVRKAGGLWLGWEATELQFPGLLLAHGTQIASGVYPARRLAEYCATQGSALAGHVHRFDTWSKRGSRETVTYQTSGCLCNLQPKWSHKRENWQQGIVLVTVIDGTAHMQAVPFVNYRAVWGDREYRA